MKVVFRVDASQSIGTGHVLRCLALAENLSCGGSDVRFVCQQQPGDMRAEIRKAGFPVLDTVAVDEGSLAWLVVDHYELDRGFESKVRSRAQKILVIDDLADRCHDCDLLLDQNLYPDMKSRYSGLLPEGARTLLGPKYALLRPEFPEARQRARRGNELRRVLVFFGGSDPTSETAKTLRAIIRLNRPDISFDVLVGLTNPNKDELRELAGGIPNVTLLDHTDRFSDLMCRSDFAIGAGGATSWERCCLGLPSIVISVARNQEQISQALADNGYQIYLGTADEVTVETIVNAIQHCIANFQKMIAMGQSGMELVDGLGAARVAAAMKSL